MFIEKLIKENPKLINFAFKAKNEGLILPDTYLIDLDTFLDNAKKIKEVADQLDIELYFMLKQLGRNPLLGKELMKLNYAGCVAVDYKEAILMLDNNIPLANVGHLEQIPLACLNRIIASKPKVITVYSKENINKINDIANKLNIKQDILLRVCDENSDVYSGQVGGVEIKDLEETIKWINNLNNVEVKGFTVFPALLFNERENRIVETNNIQALNKAIAIAEKLNLNNLNINLPSATCSSSLPLIKQLKGTSGEPGHGLSGSTPYHQHNDCLEKLAYVYVSEISHNYQNKSYCYGGGHYRRSHMKNILIQDNDSFIKTKVIAPDKDSIDYHFEIEGNYEVGKACLMAYRTQIFTTRSQVAIVSGLKKDKPEIIGIYDSLGKKIEVNW